ncbi:MAG: hypothetical protein ACE5H4_04000 [Candidatus Thorarchaeota archaeon]
MRNPTKKETRAIVVTTDDEYQEVRWQLSDVSVSSERAKKVALAAIMAALSMAVSPVALYLPRIPGWDIALFDPISFFWIIAFLVGGMWVGLVSVVAGTLGLFFFDPSVVGPFFKLEATLPMIIIPWLFVHYRGREKGGEYLASLKVYFGAMVIGAIIRAIIMVPTNLVAVPLLYGPGLPPDFIIAYTLVVNVSQSFWDAIVPFIVVHTSPVFNRFGMW